MSEFKFTVNVIAENNSKKSSKAWQFFGSLLRDGIPVNDNLIYCKICVEEKCSQESKYKPGSSVTTLSNHLRTAHRIETGNTKTAEKRTSNITNVHYSPATSAQRKMTLGRRLALMIVTDLLPFSIVNGNGFRLFALQEKIVSNISDLPSDRSLANSALNDLFLVCHQAVKQKVQSSPFIISLQLDMSTSTNGKIPLITIIATFMDDDLEIQSFSLATELFERPHTADAIADIVKHKLMENNLLEKKIFMTGDHGKNVKKSFEKIDNTLAYFDCICHSVHLVLTVDIMKDQEWKVADPVLKKIRKAHGKLCYQLYKLREIYEASQRTDLIHYLQECEETLTSYVADEESPLFAYSDHDIESILNEEYQNYTSSQESFGSFKLANATRWYSVHEMIKTYHKNFDAINQLLTQTKNLDYKLSSNEYKIMCELLSLFDIFDTAMKLLQTGTDMCSHLVLMLYDEIIKSLDSKADEMRFISSVFLTAKQSFERRVQIKNHFIVAAMLDPGQIHLPIIGTYLSKMNKTFISVLEEVAHEMGLERDSIIIQEQAHSSTQIPNNLTPAKIIRLELISKYASPQNMSLETTTIADEFSSYMLRCRSYNPNEQEIKTFWKSNSLDFPMLFQIAKVIFAIQPTSSQSERNFSISNVVLSQRRASLSPERARRILFLHDNMSTLMDVLKQTE